MVHLTAVCTTLLAAAVVKVTASTVVVGGAAAGEKIGAAAVPTNQPAAAHRRALSTDKEIACRKAIYGAVDDESYVAASLSSFLSGSLPLRRLDDNMAESSSTTTTTSVATTDSTQTINKSSSGELAEEVDLRLTDVETPQRQQQLSVGGTLVKASSSGDGDGAAYYYSSSDDGSALGMLDSWVGSLSRSSSLIDNGDPIPDPGSDGDLCFDYDKSLPSFLITCSTSGCFATPENPMIMRFCGAARFLNDKNLSFRSLIECGKITDKDECVSHIITGTERTKCNWPSAGNSSQKRNYGDGSCTSVPSTMSTRIGLGFWLDALDRAHDSGYLWFDDTHPFMREHELWECMQHSYGDADSCNSMKDSRGNPCSMCEDVPAPYYPFTDLPLMDKDPQYAQFCLSDTMFPKMCNMLKQRATVCDTRQWWKPDETTTTTTTTSTTSSATSSTTGSSTTGSSTTSSTTSTTTGSSTTSSSSSSTTGSSSSSTTPSPSTTTTTTTTTSTRGESTSTAHHHDSTLQPFTNGSVSLLTSILPAVVPLALLGYQLQ